MSILEEISTVPDIPPTYLRYFFGSKDRKIVNDVKRHADYTCQTKISQGYIINVPSAPVLKHALNKFKRGIVYYKADVVKGFAVWKESLSNPRNVYKDAPYIHPEKYIDLLLICSARPELENNSKNKKVNDRIGTRLLYDIELYSLENSFKYIILQPASPDLLDFYKKSGYILYTLPEPDLHLPLTMIKRIKPFTISKTKTTRRRRHSTEPKRGTIEYYNTLVSSKPFQTSHTYELLDKYFKTNQ